METTFCDLNNELGAAVEEEPDPPAQLWPRWLPVMPTPLSLSFDARRFSRPLLLLTLNLNQNYRFN
jgi:hypothetical protein